VETSNEASSVSNRTKDAPPTAAKKKRGGQTEEVSPAVAAHVEAEYRAGIRALRAIGETHGVSEGWIRKMAKRYGWDRDLKAKIQARADAIIVRRETVRNQRTQNRLSYAPTEHEIIEANATTAASVAISQRADIAKAVAVVSGLFDELIGHADSEAGRQLAEIVADPESTPDVLRLQFEKVLSFPARVASAKALSDSLRTVVELQRKAYGMDADGADENARRPLSDAELATKMAYFVELGKQRAAADNAVLTNEPR
jgi:hypothetical protein